MANLKYQSWFVYVNMDCRSLASFYIQFDVSVEIWFIISWCTFSWLQLKMEIRTWTPRHPAPGTNHKSFEFWLNWNRINNNHNSTNSIQLITGNGTDTDMSAHMLRIWYVMRETEIENPTASKSSVFGMHFCKFIWNFN